MQEGSEGTEFDDKGARYLTFRITGPPNADLDVDGEVPESARLGEAPLRGRGRDAALSGLILKQGWSTYETEIVVDDRTATHYRLAVAWGAWKTLASAPLHLKEMFDPKAPTGQTLLARGAWGTLRQDAVELDRLRQSIKDGKGGGFVGAGPSVRYTIDQLDPHRFAARLRFTCATGESYIGDGVGFAQPHFPVRVDVEARPYAWVEFSGVHYDPDPVKWPVAYWGQEGVVAESRERGTVLRAIVDPSEEDGVVLPSHVYAPNGRLWRSFPDPSAIDLSWWQGRRQTSAIGLVASIQLDASRSDDVRDALVEAFAWDGKKRGARLSDPLDKQATLPGAARRADFGTPLLIDRPLYGFRASETVAREPEDILRCEFRRSESPDVRFEISYPQAWKRIGAIASPTSEEIERISNALRADPNGAHSLPIIASADGRAHIWYPRGDFPSRDDVIRWQPKKPDTRVRIVIRARSGERYPEGVASTLYFFAKDTGPWFILDNRGDLVLETSSVSSRKKVRLSLRDVAAFEVETQDYGAPVYLVAKLPPATPKP